MRRLVTLATASLATACALVAAFGLARTASWADGWLLFCLVGVPALAFCALVASVAAGPRACGNVLLAAVSSMMALYMVEGLVRLAPAPIPGDVWQEREQRKVAEREGYAFDERDAHRLLLDLRGAGIDAWPTTPAEQLLGEAFLGKVIDLRVSGVPLMPLAGISSVRIDHCRESGRYPARRSDEHGFVNPPGLWSQPVEVVLVGDSFVHGMCTEAGDAIAALVRQRVPATLSVGIGGWGPLFMLAAIKEYAAAVRPKHVFWLYYEGNDLLNLRDERAAPVLPSYRTPGFSQNLFALQDSIDAGLKLFVQEALSAFEERAASPPLASVAEYHEGPFQSLAAFAKLYRVRSLLGLTDLEGQRSVFEQVPHLEEILADAKATTESWGGTLSFVYLPRYARYSGFPGRVELPHLRARGRVLEMTERLGLPVLDIDSAFRATANPRELFFYPESHYNGRGNRVVAEAILRSIETASPK